MTCLILSLILSPFRVLSPFRSAIPFRVLSPFRSAFPFRVLSPFCSAFPFRVVSPFRSAFPFRVLSPFRSAFYPHSVPLFRSVPPFRHPGSAFYPNPNKKYPPVIFHAETMDNFFLFLTKAHPEMFDNFPQKRNNKHDDD